MEFEFIDEVAIERVTGIDANDGLVRLANRIDQEVKSYTNGNARVNCTRQGNDVIINLIYPETIPGQMYSKYAYKALVSLRLAPNGIAVLDKQGIVPNSLDGTCLTPIYSSLEDIEQQLKKIFKEDTIVINLLVLSRNFNGSIARDGMR